VPVSTEGIWLRFLSGPDVAALGITRREIVDAVADVMRAHARGQTTFEPRVHLVPGSRQAGHFNVLRGHVSSLGEHGISGIKVVGDFVANYELGLPSEMALITLYDPATGIPLAIIDATFITEARTGAMTAVGARYLARRDAKILGHAGARGTAFSNVTMLDSMFDFTEIRVTSRRPESREAFAERLRSEISTPVRVTSSFEETFDGADIIVEATRLTTPQPMLHPGLVSAGAFVVPYGTISAVSPDLLGVMDKVVVDDWREAQAGSFGALRHHVDTGVLTEQTMHGELGQIIAGDRPGRESADERILLWHRGLSILDVAVAHLILERAVTADAGTMLRYR
jgi:alanine dehydrogenase